MTPNTARARVFMSGRSQHVTIPVSFRFRSSEVTVRRDPESGDVILSEILPLPEVFAALDAEPFPEGFLSDADRDHRPPQFRPELDSLLNEWGKEPA